MTKKQTLISENTRFDFKFNSLWMIGATLVLMTLAFGTVNTRLVILENKLDTLIEQQKTLITKYEGVQARLGVVELQHEKIKTILNINP